MLCDLFPWGSGGIKIFSVLAFYSNDPSLNPAEFTVLFL